MENSVLINWIAPLALLALAIWLLTIGWPVTGGIILGVRLLGFTLGFLGILRGS